MNTFDKKELDVNDFWILKDNPVTRTGIFDYLGCQISPELEPNKRYKVLRPLEEIASSQALESLKVIPFVNEHDMLGNKDGYVKPEDKGIDGVTGSNPQVKDNIVTIDLKIFTENLKDLIENGKKELSLGYTCDYIPANNSNYDFIQTNIRYNHLALVDEGRMGHDIKVMDKKITYDSLNIKEQQMEVKDVDKRELIREIMAIAAKPDTDFAGGEQEKEETIAKKLEEIAYNPSESGANDEEEIEVKEEPEEQKVVIEVKAENGVEVEGEEKILDECKDENVEDNDEDKRKLIDEIGGILKGKVDEEIWRTIIGKAEQIAYNDSESGANDEEEKPATMDSAIKYIAKRDELISKIKPHIGDNINYSKMNIKEVIKYACDKLDIKNSLDSLEGYLKAKKVITIANDSAYNANQSSVLKEYLKK